MLRREGDGVGDPFSEKGAAPVRRIARFRDQHDITRVDDRLGEVKDRLFRSEGRADLARGVELYSEAILEPL